MKQNQKRQADTKKGKAKAAVKKKAVIRPEYYWLFGLLVLVIISFYPILHKDFINFDDDNYITNNPQLQYFTLKSIPAIWTHFYDTQYSPIPTIVTGLLSMPGGFKPFPFNLTALLLHLINISLVFLFIRKLAKNSTLALMTAALFGLATLQVESIAWTAAVFKTGIYSIFFLCSLLMYLKYTDTGKIKFMLWSLFLFICSGLSKEQAVSISLAVIAIDYFKGRRLLDKKVILEKIPYLLLSIGFGVLTLVATRSGKELTVTSYSFFERLMYASYALILYVVKLIVPFKLSLFYPYPSLQSAGALFYIFPVLVIGLVVLLSYAIKKKNTHLVFGALFFILNLLFSLTLQVLSVRKTVMADRYVYIACIGFFFMLAYGVDYFAKKKIIKPAYIFGGFIVFLLVTAFVTRERTWVWKNSGTIMGDVVKNYDSDVAWLSKGIYDQEHKDLESAMNDYNNALRVNPDMALAYLNRGCLYIDYKNDSLAIWNINKAETIDPKNLNVYAIRGGIYSRLRKYDLALKDFRRALEINPRSELTYLNRGITYQAMGEYEKALEDYNALLKLRPDASEIYTERGRMERKLRKNKEALDDFNAAIRINPNEGNYYLNRSFTLDDLGNKNDALQDAQTAASMGAKVDPRYIDYLRKAINNK